MSRLLWRTILAALAVCTLLASSAATAGANPGRDHEPVEQPAGRFYGNFELDVLLFAAGTAEDICIGQPEPTVPARVHERPDGTTVLIARGNEVPFVLYHSDLGAPEFIDQTCAALFDDDPSTVPVQPFATGIGRLRERIVTSPDGVAEISNSVMGKASSPDGTTWLVRTWADFVVDNGTLIGDPAEFQGLTIREI